VILAGRRINDTMGEWIADELARGGGARSSRTLVLGVTFKENVPDLRNSKVVDVIKGLRDRGHEVVIHDPMANPAETREEYGLDLDPNALAGRYDLVVCAVAHDSYRAMDAAAVEALVVPGGVVADLKGIWRDIALDPAVTRWSL